MPIKLTEAQTKKMFKAKDVLSNMFDNGKSYGLTPYCIRDMANCYNEIVNSIEHYGMTIHDDVANLFRKCGFRVEAVETPDTNLCYHIHILTEKQEKELQAAI